MASELEDTFDFECGEAGLQSEGEAGSQGPGAGVKMRHLKAGARGAMTILSLENRLRYTQGPLITGRATGTSRPATCRHNWGDITLARKCGCFEL